MNLRSAISDSGRRFGRCGTLFAMVWTLAVHARAQEIVVQNEALTELRDGSSVESLQFPASLTRACVVRAHRLELTAGASIEYAVTSAALNQTVDAELVLRGPATFRNDNAWTHMAHMLRFPGSLRGEGLLVVRGAGDGGVSLEADNSASFRGPIRVESGNLVLRHQSAAGSGSSPITLSAGQLSLFCASLQRDLTFEADARVLIGTDVRLLGSLQVANGAIATLDSGGGNPLSIEGTLIGAGEVRCIGGSGVLRATPIRLAGERANTLEGRFRVLRGTVELAKPQGVNALAAPVVVGGTSHATLRWDGSDQVADDAPVVLTGTGRAVLETAGHRERLGTLCIDGECALRMGEGADSITFAGSASQSWSETAQWLIEAWQGSLSGEGVDRLRVGENARGLSSEQLEHSGFLDPATLSPGLYRARMLPTGELVPGEQIQPRADNAFAIDPSADAERTRFYASRGRTRLCDARSPLRSGDTLSFFGDSITWQHGFLGRIEDALHQGPGTKDKAIRIFNRGINGGGIVQVLSGSDSGAQANGRPGTDGSAAQASFADLLATDRPRLAVLFVGINDVNWRKTKEERFEEVLQVLIGQAREAGVTLVVATPFLTGEKPDRSNKNDAAIERFADILRRVAAQESITLVDLRAAALAWLQNHNRRLRLDGTLAFEALGLLTYDGIHPTDTGNELLADLLAGGIATALEAH